MPIVIPCLPVLCCAVLRSIYKTGKIKSASKVLTPVGRWIMRYVAFAGLCWSVDWLRGVTKRDDITIGGGPGTGAGVGKPATQLTGAASTAGKGP